MNVLIIDDDISICDYLSHIISLEGHHCYTAEAYSEAIDVLSHHDIDLVFIDVYLPGKDGFELTESIRSFLGSRWIPIVFISASDSDEDYKKGVEAGGDDYLVKPIRPIVVQTKLKTLNRISLMKQEVDKANEKLKKISHQDPLTKVYNRRFLQHALLREWRDAERNSCQLTVLMLDIDLFKQYNDSFGHLKGDACLQKVAKSISRGVTRPRDIVARYGGEEFLIVLPETDAEGGEVIATKIVENIRQRKIEHPSSNISDYLTVSIGISSSANGAFSYSELCDQADKALYKAKVSGRDCIKHFEVE